MSARLPRGAWPIAEARAAGKRPKDGIVVSFIGPVSFDNPIVYAMPEQRYDWSWAVGLDVLVLIRSGQNVSAALRSLHPIVDQLDVCDPEAKRGWMVGGFNPNGTPMTCRWLDRWQPLPRRIAWN